MLLKQNMNILNKIWIKNRSCFPEFCPGIYDAVYLLIDRLQYIMWFQDAKRELNYLLRIYNITDSSYIWIYFVLKLFKSWKPSQFIVQRKTNEMRREYVRIDIHDLEIEPQKLSV